MSHWAPVRAQAIRAWAAIGRLIPERRDRPAPITWVEVESDAPAAFGEMYHDLLTRAGIPVIVRDAGGTLGRGALGGVPMNIRVLVPAERAAEARELLQSDDAAPDEGMRDGREGGEGWR